jgi:hypothetical protein
MGKPYGIAVGQGGNIYETDYLNNRVQVFDSQGNFLRTWGRDVDASNVGSGFEICTAASGHTCQAGTSGELGGDLNGPNGVGTDSAGNVYVAELGNARIQKFDAQGNFLRTWGLNVDATNPGTGFEICTAASGHTCRAGASGGPGGAISAPHDIAVDAAGHVLVPDYVDARVEEYDSQGNFVRSWGKNVDATTVGSGFEICTAASGHTCQAGFTGGLAGEFDTPSGVATDAAGDVYVAELGNPRVQEFDPQRNFVRAWGKDVDATTAATGFEICTAASGDTCQGGATGGLGGEFTFPVDVAVDSGGTVYVPDYNEQRIQQYTPQGNFVRAWGKDVDATAAATGFEICTAASGDTCKAGLVGGLGGEFEEPSAIAIDPAGSTYITEGNGERIQKFVGPHTLAVSPSGTGSGSVTGGAGINCPGTCSQIYPFGTQVTLTATPAAGSTFAGWSGGCSGTESCVVTLGSDQAVTATFDLVAAPVPTGSTGQRAAALKKCKHKHGKKCKKCKKKAQQLPE